MYHPERQLWSNFWLYMKSCQLRSKQWKIWIQIKRCQRGNPHTGVYKFYNKKYLKENLFMWCRKHKFYFIFEPFYILFFLSETLITWKKTNFATFLICSKHKFCHIFESLWFDLSKTYFQWFTYSFHSHHWWVIN